MRVSALSPSDWSGIDKFATRAVEVVCERFSETEVVPKPKAWYRCW